MTTEEYIEGHIDPEPPYLHALWRATHLHLNYPRMACGHVQGRLLRMLTHMIHPRHVLELGTFSGYSTLCMASALEGDGVLHTVEVNDEQALFTRPWLEGSPWAERICLHVGDALSLLGDAGSGLPDKLDMVYIDADKRRYVDFYHAVLPRMRRGGFILADNTLWGGHVVEASVRESDAQTQGILAFNDVVASDPAVERVILPVRDGLTLIRVVEPSR